MGQLILLIGVLAMFAAGARGAVEPVLVALSPETRGEAWGVVGLTMLGVVLVSVVGQAGCLWSGRRLDRTGDHGAVRFAFLVTGVARWAVLVVFLAGLLLGGLLGGVRVLLGGDVVLLDEALTLVPLLVGLVWSWVSIAPIDRRLREAAVLRRLDHGEPGPAVVGTAGFVMEQVRHQLLVLLIPVGLITLWVESSDRLLGGDGGSAPQLVHFAGALLVIVLMPLVLRVIWRSVRLGDGALRDRLVGVCQRHGVRVSDVLLWRTGSGMVNAAVIGFLPWLRYVLLSDGLLERLPSREVEAVMAHEIGHIRRRHIVWLGGFLLSLLTVCWGGLSLLAERALIDEGRTAALVAADRAAEERLEDVSVFEAYAAFREAAMARVRANEAIDRDNRRREIAALIGVGVSLPMVVFGFGFVSRRVERQADAFAAQHLSGLGTPIGDDDVDARIDAESVHAMSCALARVAMANGMEQGQFTFRHGSIVERRRHLASLVGQPLKRTRIDRTMDRIKVVTVVLVVVAVLMMVFG